MEEHSHSKDMIPPYEAITRVQEQLYPDVGRATAELLEALSNRQVIAAGIPLVKWFGEGLTPPPIDLGYRHERIGNFWSEIPTVPAGSSIFGKVKTVLRISQPMEEIGLDVHNYYQYDYYNYLDQELGGNEFDNFITAYGYPYPARRAVDVSYFYPLDREDYPGVHDVDSVSYRTSSNELDGITFFAFAPFEPVPGFRPGTVNWRIDLYAQPVPEPATWALMILGFGAAGSALRIKRKALRAAW